MLASFRKPRQNMLLENEEGDDGDACMPFGATGRSFMNFSGSHHISWQTTHAYASLSTKAYQKC
jgi:hypothetical protein